MDAPASSSRRVFGASPIPLGSRDFARSTLKPHHAPMIRALAEAMFSHDGEVPQERLDHFPDEVDAFISPASQQLRLGLLFVLFVLRWSPLLFLRFTTFDALSVDDRVEHLERLERSRIKPLPLLIVAYKTVLTFVFYEDPKELRGLGYPGEERALYKRAGTLPIVHAHAASSLPKQSAQP
jgi:hypothetical protein